jgi:beta-glucosidase-like glycosyl hydrolase
VLKGEWALRGVLVTDWDNVGRLVHEQKVCATYADAATVAIRAGNDIMMVTREVYEGAIEAVRSGRLKEAEIDAPCARFLALKFRMGLFEKPRRPTSPAPPPRSADRPSRRQPRRRTREPCAAPEQRSAAARPREGEVHRRGRPNADDAIQQLATGRSARPSIRRRTAPSRARR